MILPQKMPMLLPRIFLAANGLHDVLTIEHADQAIDFRNFVDSASAEFPPPPGQ